MAWPKGTPRPPNAGRRSGTKNKRTVEIETYAKSIIEDPKVQQMMLAQARKGLLPPGVVQMLFYYAYGKPTELIDVEHNVTVVKHRYGSD